MIVLVVPMHQGGHPHQQFFDAATRVGGNRS
jgi:hypothetical protein